MSSISLVQQFEKLCNTPSDIYEHLNTLRTYAQGVKHVTEFGMRLGVSTVALMVARPNVLITYDIDKKEQEVAYLEEQSKIYGVDFRFKLEDTRTAVIEPTDILFIDTLHTYDQIKEELRNSEFVSKYIIFHDTVSFGYKGEMPDTNGIMPAILEFLGENKEWCIEKHYTNCNGLLILVRSGETK